MTPSVDDDLLRLARAYAVEAYVRIHRDQGGVLTIFDKWFGTMLAHLDTPIDPHLAPAFARLRRFLDRWAQGRFVPYGERRAAAIHYHADAGIEFAPEVFLTAQGAPNLVQWRGRPLLKTAFDIALYPMLLSELRPATVLEVGTASGGTALWLADHLAMLGIAAHVHTSDIKPPDAIDHAGVTLHRGDCNDPASLFPAEVLATAPRPWLVIEDAHVNVAAVLSHLATFLQTNDMLVVEDSDIKRDALAAFDAAHAGLFLVDTRYTDFFGRNATCAADSIFRRS
jgi:cephalosporin hydroxylase